MADIHKFIDGTKMKLVDNGDGSYSWAVSASISGGGGGSGPDYELAITRYRATAAGTGYSIGDSITSIRTMLVTSTGSSQAGDTLWYNDTTQANLASAPPAGNLQDIATTGITNAQMAALLAGAATAALQTTGNTSLASILTATGTPITAAAALPAGGVGIIGWLSNLWQSFFGISNNAADSGGVVKVGGVVLSSNPAYTVGNRVHFRMDTQGHTFVVPRAGGATTADGALSAGNYLLDNSGAAIYSPTRGQYWNGATWDRVRGDVNGAWTQGNVASGATDAGFGVKAAYVFRSAGVTVADGQRVDAQADAGGRALVRAGGHTSLSTLSPAVTAVTYTAGQGVGGLLTFANAMRLNVNSGIVQSVQAAIAASVSGSFDLFLFNANPSASTVGNAATFAVAAADAPKLLGVVHLTDVTAMGAAFTLFQALGQAIPCATAARDLFGVLVARSSIAMPSTSALTVNLNIMQD